MGLFGENKKEQAMRMEIERLQALLKPEQQTAEALMNRISFLQNKQQQAQAILQQLEVETENKRNQIMRQNAIIAELQNQIYKINEELEYQTVGIYNPTYEFANSDLYKEELNKIRQYQKNMVKENNACICKGAINWIVNNSTVQGKNMIADIQKLLLRAFNTECDDIVRHITVSNHQKSIQKIISLQESISKLGKSMNISISQAYVNLKICELNLALDFAQKKQEEKERLKELRAQEREEAKAQKEIEEARKKLEKEQTHYQNALKSIISQLEKNPDNLDLIAKKEELENDIADTNKAIENVNYREANRRAGYVYIISNIGAFGKDIYKIGMTRRLDPMDRIDELGSASVPFNFDVHALIFTEDAPKLESALHKAFDDKKVNKINPRREFFNVSLDEIKKVVRENFDKTVEWTDFPEAEQYRQSVNQNKI